MKYETLFRAAQGEEKANLRGYAVLAVQHVLASTTPLFEAINRAGVARENLYVLGKQYSTHRSTAKKLLNSGVSVHEHTFGKPQTLRYDYREDLTKAAQSLVQTALERTRKARLQLLVIDEGGIILPFLSPGEYVGGVEQTRSGIPRIRISTPSAPIVNVAESYAKLHYESPIIAKTIVNKIERLIQARDPRFGDVACTVIGRGAIGHAVANRLEEMDVLEAVIEQSDMKEINLFIPGEIIVGCTGTSCVDETAQFEKGAMLVSASSSNIEFLRVQQPNVRIANHGYPINFDRSAFAGTSKEIGLTRALMYAGLLQAARGETSGITPLDSDAQSRIITAWKKENQQN